MLHRRVFLQPLFGERICPLQGFCDALRAEQVAFKQLKYLLKFVLADAPVIARPVVPSCWRAWLHLASLVQERGDLPGYPLEFLDLTVVGDEVRE